MEKIGIKRLKRKRKLAGRKKCHGNNSACQKIHPIKQKIFTPLTITKEIKKSLWQRFMAIIKRVLSVLLRK